MPRPLVARLDANTTRMVIGWCLRIPLGRLGDHLFDRLLPSQILQLVLGVAASFGVKASLVIRTAFVLRR